MQGAGIKDSREDALIYCRLLAQGQTDEELVVAFVEKSPEMLTYLTKRTPLKWIVNGLPDYHPEWPGGKRRVRSLSPAKYKDESSGAALMKALYEAARERGVEFIFNSRGRRLSTDASGGVIGIQALTEGKWTQGTFSGGESIHVRAQKGVILTTGGFEWNQQRVKHYLRGPTLASVNLPLGQGDALVMAAAVRADLSNLNECWGLPIYLLLGWEEEVNAYRPEEYAQMTMGLTASWQRIIPDWMSWRGKPGVIMVNRYGKRFCNEGADYDTTWRSFLSWENFGKTRYPNIPGYVIADATAWGKWGIAGVKPGSSPPDCIKQAKSLTDLATKLGIDGNDLEQTVSEFNRHAKQGRDPEFHRGEGLFDRFPSGDVTVFRENPEDPFAALAPLETPPFYGAAIWPGNCGTCGGPRVNRNAQVLNPFGEAILGLYAAGNAAGIGAPGAGYGGPGGTIGPGLTFGYIAGQHAAHGESSTGL